MLREFLGTCPANERKLLYDHYVAGRSFADIARDRGVTRAAIKMRHDAVIRRARKFFGLDMVHGAAISHP
jgi:DNA-directed RNA polymerase specialized sigma24 family protein